MDMANYNMAQKIKKERSKSTKIQEQQEVLAQEQNQTISK